MLKSNLEIAVEEAKEFLRRAEAVSFRKRYSDECLVVEQSKASSALKRQSMELTRALSQLRNGE